MFIYTDIMVPRLDPTHLLFYYRQLTVSHSDTNQHNPFYCNVAVELTTLIHLKMAMLKSSDFQVCCEVNVRCCQTTAPCCKVKLYRTSEHCPLWLPLFLLNVHFLCGNTCRQCCSIDTCDTCQNAAAHTQSHTYPHTHTKHFAHVSCPLW